MAETEEKQKRICKLRCRSELDIEPGTAESAVELKSTLDQLG
jgi:hypothetical protein